MQAIITAGGMFKADNPLFIETGIANKALLPIGGKPMVQWVAEALGESQHVDGLVVVGLKDGDFDSGSTPVQYLESRGNLVDNVLAGIDAAQGADPAADKAILCSSDIPLITGPIVDEFVQTCLADDAEIHYAVVEEKTMEARFPNSNRTFTP
ncbi:MAG: NTP transferase domain-containing protein, partial [Anaerolineae bacterium]